MKATKYLTSLSALTLFAASVSGVQVAYEGFGYSTTLSTAGDYSGNDGYSPDYSLRGRSGGDGLAGSWAESTEADLDDWFILPGSLSFGDAATGGNRVAFNSNLDQSQASRSLDATAQSTLDSGSSIFFSILVNPTEVASASRGGFALTNTNLAAGGINNSDNTYTAANSLVGFGFGSTGSHAWQLSVWDGSTLAFGGTGDLGAAAGTQASPDQGSTYMLVGEMSFNTGSGGADEFSLYNYQLNAGSIVGGSLVQIGTTLEADIDETALDLLNLNRQRYYEADEIRIGQSLSDVVVAVPEPSAFVLIGLAGLLLLRRRRA